VKDTLIVYCTTHIQPNDTTRPTNLMTLPLRLR